MAFVMEGTQARKCPAAPAEFYILHRYVYEWHSKCLLDAFLGQTIAARLSILPYGKLPAKA
jgi:hypothetical protein